MLSTDLSTTFGADARYRNGGGWTNAQALLYDGCQVVKFRDTVDVDIFYFLK